MGIEKNNCKVSRIDSECSPRSKETMSSVEDEPRRRNSALESDDEFDDADSGAGSDDFDLLELGETGAEFCQIGNQTCGIPFELYDLAGLEDILSVDVWNECLCEEERFELAQYMPDLDQETFVQTLKELFTGCNFHFGIPIKKLFDMLKGGLCEPRVALYKGCLNFFQRRQHYHLLRKHQNSMLGNLCQIRDAWRNCRGYSIEERLRLLNIMRSQKNLMSEIMENQEVDSSDEESGEGILTRKNKDRKTMQKRGRHASHGADSSLEIHPRWRSVLEPERYGKQNPKGTLKLAGIKTPSVKDPVNHISSGCHGLGMDPELNVSATVLLQQRKSAGYDSGPVLRIRDQLRNDGIAEEMYGMGVQQDQNMLHSNLMERSEVLRVGKRHGRFRGEKIDTDNLMGVSLSSKAYSRNANQSPDMKIVAATYDFPKKGKFPDDVEQFVVGDWMKSKGRGSHLPLKGNLVDSSDQNDLCYNNKRPAEEFDVDSSFKYDDWNLRSKKRKTGRDSPDLGYTAYRTSPPLVSDGLLPSNFRTKALREKLRGASLQNGGQDMAVSNRVLLRGEETESDSSEQLNDDEETSPLSQGKFSYMSGPVGGSRMTSLKSYLDPKKAKFVEKDLKKHGVTHSKKTDSFTEQGHMASVENFLSRSKQTGKVRNVGLLHNSSGKLLEEGYPSLDKPDHDDDDDDWGEAYKFGKYGQIRGEPVERLDMPSLNAYKTERKKKARTGLDHPILESKYLPDNVGNGEDSLETRFLEDDSGVRQGRGRKGQRYDAYKNDQHGAPLLVCNSVTKKRKVKDDVTNVNGLDEDSDLLSNFIPRLNDPISLKRKSKKILEAEIGSSNIENSEPPVGEMGMADMELEIKPQKKAFTLITPTVHNGFSFSIIHLLSAVRMAMISPLTDDSLEVGKSREEQNNTQEGGVNGVMFGEKVVSANIEQDRLLNFPSLTIQEIVNRVRSNPGDPCILETQEPLQDLVRGVLKIFSSKTAPLGAKGWKVLAVYKKPTRSWSWTGPVSRTLSDNDTIEVTSPDAWVLPHKMLVKLVDSFANWLKCGQETLKQIGSLPAPPLAMMQVNIDEKERFRDLRAQRSLNTISPSSEEVRAYFRMEEELRYSIPDRAFSYTAADGKKSIVAPLRRCGGKPTSKPREHFLLKHERPPHVTILCVVRDAAARLPGSIGTRADVCTLIRDSQYVVEDVSDTQVNQVVSGALDRLHYERDPCVQFDGERKLWVYLHREREEEDFEDDGTSSTKKCKRQRKEAADQSDQGAVTLVCHGTGEQSGYDLCSDLNAEPSCIDDDKGMELLSNDVKLNAEDNFD